MRRTLGLLPAMVLVGAACGDLGSGSSDVTGPPDGPDGPGAPPTQPAPTGSKWTGVEVDGACGTTSLAWVLVDEVCGGTESPDYLDAFHAPMFRDGAAIGPYLYTVDAANLWIIDRDDPNLLERHNLLTGLGHPLAAASYEGDLLLAGGDAGLVRLDLSDPLMPTQKAQVPLDGPALDLHIQGTRAYVATGDNGMVELDLATEIPTVVRTVPIAGFAAAVFARNDIAVVAACNTVSIVDLATGQVRASVWLSQAIEEEILVAPAKDVAIVGDTAFVAAGRYGVVAIDISDLDEPEIIGNCTIDDDLAFYASGVRAQDDQLYVAGGEWGVLPIDVSDPASACPAVTLPLLLPLPSDFEDKECSAEPPWEVVPWQASFVPPSPQLPSAPEPGQDPIQILPDGATLYAFGDATRVGLRAVDLRDTTTVDLEKFGRYEEPRLLNGIAAHDGVVLAVGTRGRLLVATETGSLLAPAAEQVSVALDGIAGEILDDGRWVVATGNKDLFIQGQAAPFNTGVDVWPNGLAVDGDAIVVPTPTGARTIHSDGTITAMDSGKLANLPPAISASNGKVHVAAPEWTEAILLGADSREMLSPHGVFGTSDVMNASLWRAGLPRRLLIPSAQGLVEVASLGVVAGLSLHGGQPLGIGLPNATYIDGESAGTKLYLLSSERGTYTSQIVTVDLGGPSPTIVETQSFVGMAAGLAIDGSRLYVADADVGIRVYSIDGNHPALLSILDLTEAP